MSGIRAYVGEYFTELGKQDVPLWMFVLMMWAAQAILILAFFKQHPHGQSPAEIEQFGDLLARMLYVGIAIPLGRPLLTMLARRGREWYRGREVSA